MSDPGPQRDAQRSWALEPVRRRLRVVKAFRGLLAEKAEWVAKDVAAASASRPAGRDGVTEVLSSEVLPLCDAAKFLEREAGYWLRPQRLGWPGLRWVGRPAWLFGASATIRREPLGVVLIIAAGNYPLFLPGVQALQALAAGNAVVLKPGHGGSVAAGWLRDLLAEAGLPGGLLTVTDETVEAATGALDAGVDKLFLTGSVESGRAVLRRCAETITPACVELSGSDAVFVLRPPEAPNVPSETPWVPMAAKAVAFGLRLNGSQTCIAPRRVLIDAALRERFVMDLRDALALVRRRGGLPVDPAVMARVWPLVEAAEAAGASRVCGAWEPGAAVAEPVVLDHARPEMELLHRDVFAPVVSVVACDDGAAMLAADAVCPYALGASVFGPPKQAAAFAATINAGSVCVNDAVAPTADPRLPFGGRGQSGFGVTRGAEGLLEMTRVKAVSVRRGVFRPHYDEPGAHDAETFSAYLRVAHGGGLGERLAALPGLVRGLRRMRKTDGR